MKKLLGILAGLCACCLIFGGITLSQEHYTASAATVESESMEEAVASTTDKIATSLTVYLGWTDNKGIMHPCQYTKFQVADKPFAGETYYTEGDGYCTLSALLARGLIYESEFIIYAAGEDVEVKTQAGELYCLRRQFTLTAGDEAWERITFTMDNDFGQAMQIAQAAITGARYAEAMMQARTGAKYDIADVTVSYPDVSKDNTCYSYEDRTIHLWPSEDKQHIKSYAAWDVILHEYGHHVQKLFGIIVITGERHSGDENCIDKLVKRDENGTIISTDHKERGVELAWGEGWATYFSVVAQQYYATDLQNIDTVGDARFDPYSGVQGSFGTLGKHKGGEGNEYAIAMVLYHLYGEGGSNLGHQNMWNYEMNSKAVTFSQFAKYIYDNQIMGIDEFGKMLEECGFAPINIKATYRVEEDGKMVDKACRADKLPTFVWTGKGGSGVCQYNYFILHFYDADKKELPIGTSVTIKHELGFYRFELPASCWDTLLRAKGTSYFIRIEAMQKGDYTTGPYSSPMVRMEKPCQDIVDFNQCYGKVNQELGTNECIWFRYVAPLSGRYSFDMFVRDKDGNKTNEQVTVLVFPSMAYDIGNGRLYAGTGTDLTWEYVNNLSGRQEKNLAEGQELYFRMSIPGGHTGRVYIRAYWLGEGKSLAVDTGTNTLCVSATLGELPTFRLMP